jgi:alkylation response protein AidB-like acyl-CoA dehydrogenase
MLNLNYEPAQSRLDDELKQFANEQLTPLAREDEASGGLSEDTKDALRKFGLPGADGFASGTDDPISFCMAAEGLAHGDAGIAYAWLASRQVAWLIAGCGTAEQKAKWLPRFAEDPALPASLFLLEGRGQAPSELETSIRAVGNHLVVDGYKAPVMYPGEAVLSVIVGKDENGQLAAVLAENLDGAVEFGGTDSGRLALSACPSALEARIDNLELPPEALMNTQRLHRAVTECRLAHASICVGTAAAATRYAGAYARERLAFGKPIIAFQGVSFPLVDLLLEAEAAHVSILNLLTNDAASDEQRERCAGKIIGHANQLVIDAAREGVQTMGVAGVITEHPQERAYRSAGVLASVDFDPLNEELILR